MIVSYDIKHRLHVCLAEHIIGGKHLGEVGLVLIGPVLPLDLGQGQLLGVEHLVEEEVVVVVGGVRGCLLCLLHQPPGPRLPRPPYPRVSLDTVAGGRSQAGIQL